MKEINERLNNISELIDRVDAKVLDINTKLDELIKALHEYDGNDEYGESSFEAFQLTNDYISSFNVDGAERRMDIIGQNGNTGEHYDDDRELGGEGQNNINKLSNMKNGILAAIILIAFIGFIIGAYHYPIIMIVISYIIGVWSILFVWWTIKFILDIINNK